MKKRITKALGLLTLLIFGNIAFAQDITLDPVTVTASLVEKRSSETGRNITIIKGDSFLKLPIHSIDELLKYIPGVEVQSRGPQGSQSDISMRGGTFQQVLIILDGLRLNDPNTGHFSAYIPITPAEIDRIEVLKGASSAIYGSDAVGGVINIITKAFNAAQQKTNKILQGSIAAGEYGLASTNIGGYYKTENVAVGAGVLANHSTGVLQRGTRGYFHNTSASAAANIRVADYWNISIRVAYDDRNFSAQNFYTTYVSDTASEEVKSIWVQTRAAYEKGGSKLSLDAGYKKLNDYYLFNKIATANANHSQLYQALLLFRQIMNKKTSLITGFNIQQKLIASNDRGSHSLVVAAPFANVVQQVGKNIMLQPSLRIEFIGSNVAEWVPQLTTSVKLNHVQLRISGGKTIRSADFTERYNNYNKAYVASGSIGNPDLVAEKSWGYEAGADWFYKSNFKLSGTFFQRFHTQLIDWVTTAYADMPRKINLKPGGTYALSRNIAEVTTIGAEVDAQYIHRWSHQYFLTLNAGATWMDDNSSETTPSFYISSHAKFLFNFSVTYHYGAFSSSFSGIYKNRKPQQATAINAYVSKDYFSLNNKTAYEVWRRKLSVFVQVDNIFNRQYSDLLGSVMPGRWLQGGVSFRFE
jgi:vitamin B12 transporter